MLRDALFSLDHGMLLETLAAEEQLLLIQDLDGVCMGLVRDPRTRVIEASYIEATRRMAGEFFVLTNGEHAGSRGVNRLIEAAFPEPGYAAAQQLYLPGLAAGGVQWQDAAGSVAHPGVSDEELAFLQRVPAVARRALREHLADTPLALPEGEIDALVTSCVLDNALSPTLNLNPLHERYGSSPERYRSLQRFAEAFMRAQLELAEAAGLGESFFLHLAPNAGRDEQGERLRLAEDDAGTTDFQLMLSGAVKEVGVLVLLNHYLYRRSGAYPLGADFNAREAPGDSAALLDLAASRIDPALLPRIVGVGDTLSSHADPGGGAQRGGSDRGFLSLVQGLGEVFDRDNATVFVDSSAGEVRRPGVDAVKLPVAGADGWAAVRGISDPHDPLRVNFLFPEGYRQYTAFFRELAARRAA